MELSTSERFLITELTEQLRTRHNDILVSCSEAARLLNVTPATVSTYIKQGRLHKVTLGFSTGIRLSEIQKYAL